MERRTDRQTEKTNFMNMKEDEETEEEEEKKEYAGDALAKEGRKVRARQKEKDKYGAGDFPKLAPGRKGQNYRMPKEWTKSTKWVCPH